MTPRRFCILASTASVIAIAIGVFVFTAHPALAQGAVANLTEVADATNLGQEDIRIIIGRVVRIVLGFLGIVAVLLVMYGGFLWMTARGDTDKVEQARKVLMNAGIGLIIILSSLAITQFVLNALSTALGLGQSSGGGDAVELIDPFSTALGAGSIDWHYPRRNALDVPRNTNLSVAFRDPISPGSIMDGYADDPTAILPLKEGSVLIYQTDAGRAAAISAAAVQVAMTPDQTTFVFNPDAFLGSASANTGYTVELTPDITLATGTSAFTGAFGDGYSWRFEVSTELDLTPPTVESVIPVKDSTVARNILIQVNFSEAVDPTTASGFYPGVPPIPNFTNITATYDENSTVGGTWTTVNQSETSEFVSNNACGTNSCGETIYCLPGNEVISVEVLAASVGTDAPAAALPYNGVVDMAGNALDGNDDGTATGPVTDSYAWGFSTTNDIELDPPVVTAMTPTITPGNPAQNIDFDQPVRLTFDSLLSLSSVTADNITVHTPSEALWFFFESTIVPVATGFAHQVTINHGIFSANILYGLETDSGLRSVYQNCFTPSRTTSCVGTGANCCNDQAQAGACSYPNFTL